jgi:hypothetical protein
VRVVPTITNIDAIVMIAVVVLFMFSSVPATIFLSIYTRYAGYYFTLILI